MQRGNVCFFPNIVLRFQVIFWKLSIENKTNSLRNFLGKTIWFQLGHRFFVVQFLKLLLKLRFTEFLSHTKFTCIVGLFDKFLDSLIQVSLKYWVKVVAQILGNQIFIGSGRSFWYFEGLNRVWNFKLDFDEAKDQFWVFFSFNNDHSFKVSQCWSNHQI